MKLDWWKIGGATVVTGGLIIAAILGFAWKGCADTVADSGDEVGRKPDAEQAEVNSGRTPNSEHSLPQRGQGGVSGLGDYLENDLKRKELLRNISFLLAEDNLNQVFETRWDTFSKYLSGIVACLLAIVGLLNFDTPLQREELQETKETKK